MHIDFGNRSNLGSLRPPAGWRVHNSFTLKEITLIWRGVDAHMQLCFSGENDEYRLKLIPIRDIAFAVNNRLSELVARVSFQIMEASDPIRLCGVIIEGNKKDIRGLKQKLFDMCYRRSQQ